MSRQFHKLRTFSQTGAFMLAPVVFLSTVHAAVNAVGCKVTASCAITWASAPGDPVWLYTRWGISGGGTVTDSQGNVYTQFRISDTYRSHRRAYWATAKAAGALTVSFSVPQEEIVIVSAPGYLPAPDQVVSFPPLGTGGTFAVCPTSPLSIATSADSLLISDWAMDAQTGQSCTALSGTPAVPGTCGGFSGQVRYEIATAGPHLQQFTFLPGFNAGNDNCGMASFSKVAAPVPSGGWVFLGDSITANEFTVATQWHAGGINSGVAGNTTQQMIDRFTPSVLAYHPAGVVILGGVNDVNGLAGPTTAAAIAGRLASMADTAIAAGIQVVLCSILPLGAARTPTASQLQMIVDTNTSIKAYVAGHPGTRYADYYTAMVGLDGLLPPTLSLDGLHPLPAGYTIMYGITEAAINPPVTPPPVPSTIDRPTLIQMLGLTTGSGLQLVDTGTQLIISQPVFTSRCIPQSISNSWTITQQQHGRTDDGLSVTVYDDQIPRHRVEADVSVNPANLTVTVSFAVPQAGCVVVR